jgi:hypothetical protein
MRRRTAAASLAILLLWASPALAWEPIGDDPPTEPTPPEPTPAPDPAPLIAPPPGVYYVTDTYVADVVTSSGPVTTYSTATVHESTGSYARVLQTVGTSEPSSYDGSAFNGRRRLADGRMVAGTYYENYVLDSAAFVVVSIVFFQDDAEIARALAATPSPSTPSDDGPATPADERFFVSSTGLTFAPACCSPDRAVAGARPTLPPTSPIRPGISLRPASAPLAMIEVLRGREITLWPRAFVDDREVPVRSWSVIAGEPGDALTPMGSGAVPFRTSWPRLAPPGATFQLVLRIEVDTPDTGHQVVDATIAVLVRSPALEH